MRCPLVAVGIGRVEQGHRHAVELDPLVAGVLVLAAVGVVVAAHDVQAIAERRAVARFEGGELVVRLAVVVRSPLTTTAARSAAAISATAARFIVSGYGSASGGTRRIGPSVWSSMRPASISPKWTSLTVAKPAAQRPGRAGERAERDAVALVARCPVRGRRRWSTSTSRRGTWTRRVVGDGGQLDATARTLRPRAGRAAAGSAGSTSGR